MKYVRLLKEMDKHHVQEAGGKGASLGELLRAGIPVPKGFVITSDTFETFIKDTGLDTEIEAALDRVDTREMHTVENASERIHTLIEKEDLPEIMKKEIVKEYRNLGAKYVAVRSSATTEDSDIAAWAGQLETFLNTTDKTLIEHVKRCWASLFSPRAICYRFEKGFHKQKVSVAIVVQAMVESEKSGIAFSVHPVTQDRNQLIIEAGFGLGEAIVSGSITPDSYVIRKDCWKIMDKRIQLQERGLCRAKRGGNEWRTLSVSKGKKPTLSDAEAINLAKLIARIEKHYGFPVDIEWAMIRKRLFVLQSRPITTLSNTSKTDQKWQRSEIRNGDYKTLFKLKGRLTCLHAEFFIRGSLGLGDPVVVFKDGNWHTFIHKEKELLCLKKGLKIFSKKDAYEEYADGFRAYIKMAREKIIPRFKKPVFVSKKELEKLLPIIGKFWYFYGITEFSYHDLAYEQYLKTKDPILKKNLDDLGKLKFKGRELLNDYIFEDGVLHNLLRGIAQEFLSNEDDAEFLFGSEILSLYEGARVDNKLIQKRRLAYGCAMVNEHESIFSYDEALNVWDELHSLKQSTMIRGIIANKGKASGKAIIAPMLVNPKAIAAVAARMNKGNILIAESTTPELMSLCNKAAAIVTDQGGMLSHAAIVSRELNIPCIIGTGDATEILKDGDIVHVDADKGFVERLSNMPFDSSRKWVPYLTRPFNLFGASLWQAWYDSDLIKKLLGTYFPSALFIEEHLNVVRLYREPSDLSAFKAAIKKIVTKKEAYLQSIFRCGFELNDEALAYINGKKKCTDLDEAVRFMIELALHATIIPNFALPLIVEIKKESKLKKLGEELRGKSHYPKFISHVLMPLAKKKLQKLRVVDPKHSIELITLQELLSGNVQDLPRRTEARYKLKQRFVYQKANKDEIVSWVSDPLPLIADLEKIDLGSSKGLKQLKGQVAFKGKVKGIARVVLTDDVNVKFNKDDILVSIHSSPTLMPLLLKCAAIVTDEGGISCHAAIVSRELKKPCVMSTKIATSIIKDGDLVQVDAEQGIVRILKQRRG